MTVRVGWRAEWRLAAKFAAVGLVGFATDALIMRLGLAHGVEPAWARVASLFCAMQVTFTINGLVVFKCLNRTSLIHQWRRYMVANGFGNFCNYWIFVTLVSTHWPVIANPMVAIAVGSATAWAINYLGTRFYAFAKRERRKAPAPTPRLVQRP